MQNSEKDPTFCFANATSFRIFSESSNGVVYHFLTFRTLFYKVL